MKRIFKITVTLESNQKGHVYVTETTGESHQDVLNALHIEYPNAGFNKVLHTEEYSTKFNDLDSNFEIDNVEYEIEELTVY